MSLSLLQVRAMFTTGSYTGARKSNMEVCSKVRGEATAGNVLVFIMKTVVVQFKFYEVVCN